MFLAVIALPIVDRGFGIDASPPLNENRPLATRPEVPGSVETLRAFPPAFERYWHDSFGFRRLFIRLHHRALVTLRTSPIPDRVTVGSDGWLFYAADHALSDYLGERPFRESELVRWQHLLEARRDWLADRGIRYLFVIAPSKESVYGEHMPRRIARGNVRRFDQLLGFMAAHSDFEIMDPRPLLTAAKPAGEVYRRTDSHWSARGAWLVTEAIAHEIAESFPAAAPLGPDDVRASTGIAAGDLVSMLGVDGFLFESCESIEPIRRRARSIGTPDNISSWTAIDDPSLPRGVFFHDSFGIAQQPFLAERFRRLRTAAMSEMDADVIAVEQPQIVIQEMAERFLLERLPNDSMLFADNSRVRAAFDASSRSLIDRTPIEPVPPLVVEAVRDGPITLQVPSAPASALLSAMPTSAEWYPVVRVTLDSPGDGVLMLSYQTARAPSYDDDRRLWFPLRSGLNVAWFTLSDPELAGPIRLDLTVPGTYRLAGLEARAVPRR